jgi:hypothetical protein
MTVAENPKQLTDEILRQSLVYDIETWAEYPTDSVTIEKLSYEYATKSPKLPTNPKDPKYASIFTQEIEKRFALLLEKRGTPISIKEDFDTYVACAVVKWIGFYSFREDTYVEIPVTPESRETIRNTFKQYTYYIGANNEDFDEKVCINNRLIDIPENWNDRYVTIDVQKIIGENPHVDGFKMRGKWMGLPCKKYSLGYLAELFKLDVAKGDIDYDIFKKDTWSENEIAEIKKYLHKDVLITKEVFMQLWDFWIPFTEDLSEKNIKNVSWLRSSLASLNYKSICDVFDLPEEYENITDSQREELGGRAIYPLYAVVYDVVDEDAVSLYPHMVGSFSLSGEVTHENKVLDGRNHFGMFKTRGYYPKTQHFLDKHLMDQVKTRVALKKIDKKNKKVYTLKIKCNSFYGMIRSATFKSVHKPNAGYDCCYLGQQVHKFVQKYYEDRGYIIVGGFTDSWFVKRKDGILDVAETKRIADEAVEIMKKDMPFPQETFTIDIECVMKVLLYSWDYTKLEFRKNNYYYVTEKDGKYESHFTGLPIMKDSATEYGMWLFKTFLEPQILGAFEKGEKPTRFSKEYLLGIIQDNLADNMEKMAVQYNCKKAESYAKPESQIQAQLSTAYLYGGAGSVQVIKNKTYGDAGKGDKYCLLEDVDKLQPEDIVVDKVYTELQVFCEEELTDTQRKPIKLQVEQVGDMQLIECGRYTRYIKLLVKYLYEIKQSYPFSSSDMKAFDGITALIEFVDKSEKELQKHFIKTKLNSKKEEVKVFGYKNELFCNIISSVEKRLAEIKYISSNQTSTLFIDRLLNILAKEEREVSE